MNQTSSPSAPAVVDPRLTTDPRPDFFAAADQAVHLIDSNDHDDLVRCCAQLASTGDFIELRKLADDGDDVSGAPEPNSTDTANPTDLTNATNPTDTPLEGPLP